MLDELDQRGLLAPVERDKRTEGRGTHEWGMLENNGSGGLLAGTVRTSFFAYIRNLPYFYRSEIGAK